MTTEATGGFAGLFAGMTDQEKRDAILLMMGDAAFANVSKDQAAVKKAKADAEAARLLVAADARVKLVGEALTAFEEVAGTFRDRAGTADVLGFSIVYMPNNGIDFKPIVKAEKSKVAGVGGSHASGGSSSPTSVKSKLGETPAQLFERYASPEEKEFYARINNLSTEAFSFKKLIYVPAALEAGVAPDLLPSYSKVQRAEWDTEGEDGKTFKTWAAQADMQRKPKA